MNTSRSLQFLAVVLTLLGLAGCAENGASILPSPTPGPLLPTSTLVQPSPTPTPTPLPLPPATAVQPPAPVGVTIPALYYFSQGAVYRQTSSDRGEKFANLSSIETAGEIKASLSLQGAALLLRGRAIERVLLPAGEVKILTHSTLAVSYGQLIPVPRTRQMIVVAALEDATAEFSSSTQIWVYSLETDELLPVFSAQAVYQPLGLTPDGRGVYLIPRGQDPSYGEVQTVSLQTGQVVERFPVRAYGDAFASPDGKTILIEDDLQLPEETTEKISLYHPEQPVAAPTRISLPCPYQRVAQLSWSIDSQRAFGLLAPDEGRFGEGAQATAPCGLWFLDVSTDKLSPVMLPDAPTHEGKPPIMTVSAGGACILLRFTGQPEAWLVDTGSATAVKVGLPESLIVPGSQRDNPPPSFLSADGKWLLQQIPNETFTGWKPEAILTHLEDGQAITIHVPADMEFIGWES
ncbi:MAG: hypothetical protein PHQ40_10275 [Anaerolineaceae bacterium]|nr:hypothetical protein [Anaerolineaceae bacterium]